MKKYLLSLLLCLPALAGTITYTASVGHSTDYAAITASIPKWNPALGTLESVTVVMKAGATNRIAFENHDDIATVWTDTVAVTNTVSGPGILLPVTLHRNETGFTAAFDGTDDLAGPSGFDSAKTAVAVDVQFPSFLPYTGVGSVTFSSTANAVVTYAGPGDYLFLTQTSAGFQVWVTYSWSEPCPTTQCGTGRNDGCDRGGDRNDDRNPCHH